MDILKQLKAARDKAAFELGRLEAAVSALSGSGSRSEAKSKFRPKRHVSTASRRRMAAAQRARWAKRSSNELSMAKPRRIISAAGRRRIAAAQRARWAKVKQGKKAA